MVFARDRNRRTARDWADRNGRLEIAIFLHLQEKSISNSNGRLTPVPMLSRSNTMKQSTSASQSDLHRLKSAQSRTMSGMSLPRNTDLEGHRDLLELDSD